MNELTHNLKIIVESAEIGLSMGNLSHSKKYAIQIHEILNLPLNCLGMYIQHSALTVVDRRSSVSSNSGKQLIY
jgi:hypothetical protein